MYLISIHKPREAAIAQSCAFSAIWNHSRVMSKQWEVADYQVAVSSQRSVPIRELHTADDDKKFTLLIGTQVMDQLGTPSGPWVKIEIEPVSGRLTISRDPAGLMAAFFVKIPGGYLISDSVPHLLQYPQVSRVIDLAALNEYWFLDYCIPPKTIWRAVRAVPNGHRAILSPGVEEEPRYEQYFTPRVYKDEARTTKEDAPRVLRQIVLDVAQQSLAALAGGTCVNLLSGGIDSSVVFAACNLLGLSRITPLPLKGRGMLTSLTLPL